MAELRLDDVVEKCDNFVCSALDIELQERSSFLPGTAVRVGDVVDEARRRVQNHVSGVTPSVAEDPHRVGLGMESEKFQGGLIGDAVNPAVARLPRRSP